MKDVVVGTRPLPSLRPHIGESRLEALIDGANLMRGRLTGRTVWQINTTASGGGVAELLHSLLPYLRHAGVDARWCVVDADARFVDIAKRLCLLLYGDRGTPELTTADLEYYTVITTQAAEHLAARCRHGDIVVLHDPQTAGMVAPLKRAGALVVWRSHIGSDAPSRATVATWAQLAPMLRDVDRVVFSTARHVPAMFQGTATVVLPSIDPLTAKNQVPTSRQALDVLVSNGLLIRPERSPSTSVVHHVSDGRPPGPTDRLVTQVSRWDVLKDMRGVMRGFALIAEEVPDVHLVLAGPDVTSVSDDPGGQAELERCVQAWRQLPGSIAARVHLVVLPPAGTGCRSGSTSAMSPAASSASRCRS